MDLAELKIKYWDKIREELRPSFLGESTERDYATYIHLKLRELDYPLTFEAFDDYEFGVATSRLRLLRPDQKVILNDHI
ncbi:MAG: hypothetical protein KKF56_00905, partial [Nanoarchaeota archaeon]|nr:hypothetical protein [Nanoarchaeota archaeon]